MTLLNHFASIFYLKIKISNKQLTKYVEAFILYLVNLVCVCGEMDITTVYGTVVPGSNPGRRTNLKHFFKCFFYVFGFEPLVRPCEIWTISRSLSFFLLQISSAGFALCSPVVATKHNTVMFCFTPQPWHTHQSKTLL